MTVRRVDNIWITLSDGTRLAARLWLPSDAETNPVPAVLEYLPYRKDDGTAGQDETRHPYFARHGYASVRVDIRGTGDSDGILCDEYLRQEQDDALEVLAWIAEQPWCTGKVGMIGYSWGGFNGLQVAARRPPELAAIVTAYSTDDRYLDDCHYMGGCLLGSDMLKWATSMRVNNALPPDPRFRDDWREVWRARIEGTPAFIEPWLTHQRLDDFWRQGSVATDYSAIEAATLVVGGWADAYTNAVPRLLRNLTCERRGFIGPWAHVLPYAGVPGPAIGFLTECVRWFDRWLKGLDSGVEADPMLRAWMQEPVAPAGQYAMRPGRWVALDEWPAEQPRARTWHLGPGMLGEAPCAAPALHLRAPQHTGATAGVWCANGYPDELAIDQREDDALSVCFDTAPLRTPVEVLGSPRVRLNVSADAEHALIVARLCEVSADGASTLVSWGLLNLTHRNGHDAPDALRPGEAFGITVDLNVIGHRFAEGSVIRLALSQAYWPHAWPSPAPVTLTVHPGGSLDLPLLPPNARDLANSFAEPENEHGTVRLRAGTRQRERASDPATGTHTIVDTQHFDVELDSGTRYASTARDEWTIGDGDPLSARAWALREESLVRGEWRVRVVAEASLTATCTHFLVHDTLAAYDGDEVIFSSGRSLEIPRDHT